MVCSDDSGSIATVTVRNFETTKLTDLVDKILPECLNVNKSGDLLLDFEGKIIYERCEDMSEDESEVFVKRLAKSFTELSFKPFSTMMLQADLNQVPEMEADLKELSGQTIYI